MRLLHCSLYDCEVVRTVHVHSSISSSCDVLCHIPTPCGAILQTLLAEPECQALPVSVRPTRTRVAASRASPGPTDARGGPGPTDGSRPNSTIAQIGMRKPERANGVAQIRSVCQGPDPPPPFPVTSLPLADPSPRPAPPGPARPRLASPPPASPARQPMEGSHSPRYCFAAIPHARPRSWPGDRPATSEAGRMPTSRAAPAIPQAGRLSAVRQRPDDDLPGQCRRRQREERFLRWPSVTARPLREAIRVALQL